MKKILFNMLVFILLFSTVSYGLLISEVMYDPLENDNYNEWIEIYSDENINVENLTICNDTISISTTNYSINNDSFFIIADSDTNISNNYNISNNTKIFLTEGKTLCNYGLSNSGEIIDITLDNLTYSFDYTDYLNENYPIFYDFNESIYKEGCYINGTPGYFKKCEINNISPMIQELEFNFWLNDYYLLENESLIFLGDINSPSNMEGNLTIKIGKKSDSGYEYPEEWIVFDGKIDLVKGENELNDFIGNISWKAKDEILSDYYKAYASLKTEIGEKRPYEIFFVKDVGNLFLINSTINKEKILLNDSINITLNIENEDNHNLSFDYGFIIEDLKTLEGVKDVEFISDGFIENLSSKEFSFVWNETNNLISGNYSLIPSIRFNIENETIERLGEEYKIEILGFKDLGEPTLNIIDYEDSSFGKFSKAIVEYSSNNYDKNLRFHVYGYPKQVVSDYNLEGIKANDLSSIDLTYSVKRDKDYVIGIPYLLKPNCDNYYETGVYRIRIRVFENSEDEWIEWDTFDFNTSIAGKNEYLCPVKSSSSGSSQSISIPNSIEDKEKNEFNYGDVTYSLGIPKKISNKFSIEINYTNKRNITDIRIESYLYSGKKLSRENIISKNIEENESGKITLNNIVINHEEKDEYKIIVKINSSKRKSLKTYSKIVEYEPEKNTIKSFYTLQEKYQDSIKLFGSLDNGFGSVELLSLTNTSYTDANDKMIFEEKIFPGINHYFLILKDDFNNTLDVEKLSLFSDGNLIEKYKGQAIKVGFSNFIEDNNENGGILVTGNTVSSIDLDLGKTKLKKLINILLVFIFIIGAFHFWRRSY